MSTQLARMFVTVALIGTIGGCSSMNSKSEGIDISPDQMSAPARATMNKQVGDGKVEKVTKEMERGKTVYDVEANVGGKHMEYLIAEADGELLGTEAPIEFAQLPEPVKASAIAHFGTSSGLTASKGTEYGETLYEIEGMKDGKRVEVSFDPHGKKEQ